MARKPKTTRSTIRGAALRDTIMRCAPGWVALRDRFDEGPRTLGDTIAGQGLTLRDLMALEAAEYESVRVMYAAETSTRVKATLISAMVQCRKAMRALVEASGPGLGLGDQPVRVPEGMTRADFESLQREIDEHPDEIMS